MGVFSEAEEAFLTEGGRRLARIATVGPNGMPHVTPVGWSIDASTGVVQVGGMNLPATKKFRDIARNGRAAVVIDDVLPPWRPRGIEVRGRAEALTEPEPVIRIHPERIVAWGLDDQTIGRQNARDISSGTAPAEGGS